jgi:hypothetical protein
MHFFETAPEPGDDQTGPVSGTDFDDRQGQVYRAPSQAGPAMISTPGHWAPRRRQRGTLPAADGDRRGLRWAWRSLREVGSFEGADHRRRRLAKSTPKL